MRYSNVLFVVFSFICQTLNSMHFKINYKYNVTEYPIPKRYFTPKDYTNIYILDGSDGTYARSPLYKNLFISR